MTGNCKSCGNELEMVVKPFTCDLTGMEYDASFGECDCENLGERMSSYSELPANIKKKLEDLEELEKTNMALGLHDKISAARYLIRKEIDQLNLKGIF